MKTWWVFFKWFFVNHGSFKIEPNFVAVSFWRRFGRVITRHDCLICKEPYWSYARQPYPVCTKWVCYRDYQLGREDATTKTEAHTR